MQNNLILVDVLSDEFYNIDMRIPKLSGVVIREWSFLLPLLLLGIYYYSSLTLVPFHPDESSYIFMSSDFEKFFSDPLEMVFMPSNPDAPGQHYRLVDPPLTRYAIGAGLWVSGKEAISTDWDWSAGWQENVFNGALPPSDVLLASRLSVSWAYLISLFAIYQFGKRMQGSSAGLIAMLLVGTSALVLLHTRRAMEESLLLLGVCLSLWSFSGINKRPWLSALAVLLAINTKWTSAVLIPLGAISIFILDSPTKRLRWCNLVLFLLILLGGTYLLNPVAWSDPLLVASTAFQERTDLVNAQIATLAQLNGSHALTTPTARFSALISNTFFNSPSALDVGNYREILEKDIQAYLAFPGTNWLRGWTGGLLSLFITLFGLFLMISTLIFHRDTAYKVTLLSLAGFFLTAGSLAITLALPFQRYVIVFLPFLYLVMSFGISQVYSRIMKKAP